MSKPKKKDKPPRTPARFAAEAQVRVKPGTTDPDFPDIPLGAWAGTIRDVDQRSAPPTYLIEWDRHTLDHMHPVYRKRCERDGLELESMWLGEEDIETDTGGPPMIEQPTRIVTRPLNPKDEDDRVRLALGLNGDDPLPEVDENTLLTYHRYLAAHLTFPFEAKWEPAYGPSPIIKITGLSDPEDDPGIEEMYGLLCEARAERRLIEVPLAECEAKEGNPNRQLLKDYSYWFWNYR
ncbi:MAG TPA: calcium-binding protein [Gemmataceae bacterium]|nr:calcium-binding protein [Gemmataceae bacterium]